MTTLLQKIVGVGDLVLLEEINEDAILKNLKKRLLAGDIYTYIGPVVVSVNPYERHEELYADHTIDMYYGRNMYELPPHIYALTDMAYRDLVDNNRDQVCGSRWCRARLSRTPHPPPTSHPVGLTH